MGWIKERLEVLSKYWHVGTLSQLAVSLGALVAMLYNSDIRFAVDPIVKYGPPRVPPVKYGPPTSFDPVPAVQGALSGGHLTIDSIASLALLAVYSLVAIWAIFGWAFWGGIWYLRSRNKK